MSIANSLLRESIESKICILNRTISKDDKLIDYEKINDQAPDVFISSDNLNIFEVIDKSFSNFLLNLSYKINLELFKINLIKKIITEETFKCLSNNNSIIKHPYLSLIHI